MTRPAWAPDCTCGKTPLGYFCQECRAWAGSSHGDQASWSRPRMTPERIDRLIEEQAEVLQALAPEDGGKPCKNGRYASREARQGEKLLPCGCPLLAAPRECIDKVATLKVTPRRPPIEH